MGGDIRNTNEEIRIGDLEIRIAEDRRDVVRVLVNDRRVSLNGRIDTFVEKRRLQELINARNEIEALRLLIEEHVRVLEDCCMGGEFVRMQIEFRIMRDLLRLLWDRILRER